MAWSKSKSIPAPGGPATGDADGRPSSATLGPAEESALLHAAWDALPDAVFVVRTTACRIVLANPAACRLLGYSSEELRGMPLAVISPDWTPSSHTPSRAVFRTRGGGAVHVERWLRSVAGPGDVYLVLIARAIGEQDGVCDGRSANGDERQSRASDPRPPLPTSSPATAGIRSPLSDDRDALTGLPDRRQFEGRLMAALRKARSRAEYHFAVLFVDLDGFKALNDTVGALARRPRPPGHCRPALRLHPAARRDCPVRRRRVYRAGEQSPQSLGRGPRGRADRVADASPVEVEGHRATITASIGIALSWHGYRDPESMLRDADRAMYQAKAEGKARYVICTPQEGKG